MRPRKLGQACCRMPAQVARGGDDGMTRDKARVLAQTCDVHGVLIDVCDQGPATVRQNEYHQSRANGPVLSDAVLDATLRRRII
jgi:hypothetical protein